MNLLKSIKTWFRIPSLTDFRGKTPSPAIPQPPTTEPSCFAKGVAELWRRGEGWKVKRVKISPDLKQSMLDVTLTHRDGIVISGMETVRGEFGIQTVSLLGQELIRVEYGVWGDQSRVNREKIAYTILSHPYPALKRALDTKVKIDAERETKTEGIERIGCPDTQ